MELQDEFKVALDIDDAWSVLTDLERIAPCMPGAQLQEVTDDEYRGIVKVKVGPITASYKGVARFLEQDRTAHRAVLRAEGRDTRGQGNANATITASLVPYEDGTRVSVATELQITGKVAQFGRSVLADISSKVMSQFVDNLERTVLEAAPAPGPVPEPRPTVEPPPPATDGPVAAVEAPAMSTGGAAGPASAGGTAKPNGDHTPPADRVTAKGTRAPRQIDQRAAEPVNLLEVAGAPLLRRMLPLAAGTLLALAVAAAIRRRLHQRY
ncbi:MAG: SRPBCC family protein [Acidimicrobiales bacterium]